VEDQLSSTIEFVREENPLSETGTALAAVDYVFQCGAKNKKVRITHAAIQALELRQKGASPREYAKYFLQDQVNQRGFAATETFTLSAKGMEQLVSDLNVKATS
jgi:hypothetical protein